MQSFCFGRVRFCLVAVLLVVAAGLARVEAKGLADLVGEYQGVLLYAQDAADPANNVRIVGSLDIKVRKTSVILSGTIGENTFRTVMRIKGRTFTMNALLPGIDGFNQKVTGRAQSGKRSVKLSGVAISENENPVAWRIQRDSFGAILTITGRVDIPGGEPVFVSYTAG